MKWHTSGFGRLNRLVISERCHRSGMHSLPLRLAIVIGSSKGTWEVLLGAHKGNEPRTKHFSSTSECINDAAATNTAIGIHKSRTSTKAQGFTSEGKGRHRSFIARILHMSHIQPPWWREAFPFSLAFAAQSSGIITKSLPLCSDERAGTNHGVFQSHQSNAIRKLDLPCTSQDYLLLRCAGRSSYAPLQWSSADLWPFILFGREPQWYTRDLGDGTNARNNVLEG